ncbi:leukocyte receptor cluster member 9 [Eleutherodactylus coqui]|uniref:leukocyte receptor cluster member 9 n=1 Tax=Eleutherodactylus coqui TaxID=57060 RepID=UPI00346346B8
MASPDSDDDTAKASVNVDNMEEMASQKAESITSQEVGATPEAEDTICQFFLLGRCRFGDKCRNSHTGVPAASNHPRGTKEGKGKVNQTSERRGKKPPMKTAIDVIKRIQWDSHLPREHFIVGYLDRFLGTIEQYFSYFCWKDLASVGEDVLAIPKHRIQYFKYKDLVVWDKTNRIDNVFGSTGSGLTILDIIDQYETLIQAEGSALAENAQEQGDADIDNNEEEPEENCNEEEEPEEKNCKSLDQQHTKKLRPTHFIAVRISSEDVRHSIKEVQNGLQKHNPDMSEYFIPLPELHLTLCLLYLESSEDIEVAYTVLQELKRDTQRTLPPSLILSFDGLKDFYSRVLYLKPMLIPGLLSFVSTLKQSFRSKGLQIIDPPQSNSFHVTVAKIPRNVARRDMKVHFLPEVYSAIQLTHFGAQPIDCLSFCAIGSPRRTDGFYSTLLELPLY